MLLILLRWHYSLVRIFVSLTNFLQSVKFFDLSFQFLILHLLMSVYSSTICLFNCPLTQFPWKLLLNTWLTFLLLSILLTWPIAIQPCKAHLSFKTHLTLMCILNTSNDPCKLLPVEIQGEQQQNFMCQIVWFSLNSKDSREVEWVLLRYLISLPGHKLKLEQPLHSQNNLQNQNRHW